MAEKIGDNKNKESRSLDVSLGKAVQWFMGDNKELRDIALELYPEEELRKFRLETIKTFDDALNLYVRERNTDKDGKIDYDMVSVEKREILYTINEISRWSSSTAMKFKLDIVLKVLNQFSDMSQKRDNVYYPCFYIIKQGITDYEWESVVKACPYLRSIRKVVYHSLDMEIVDKKYCQIMFRVCKKHYNVMDAINFDNTFSVFDMYSIVACATNSVALQLGKYFSKMIFEAYFPYSSENGNIKYYDIPDEEKTRHNGFNIVPARFMINDCNDLDLLTDDDD